MVKKRPCRVCRTWFAPERRVGDRQYVCSRPECQRERHRRNCARWHAAERVAEAESRAREDVKAMVTSVAHQASELAASGPLSWCSVRDSVRDSVGMEELVVIALLVRQLNESSVSNARDLVRSQDHVVQGETGKHGGARPRDSIASPKPSS
jgi:hypothetical protein